MLHKIILVTLFLANVVYLQAQGMKFGVHINPLVSFMGSDQKAVKSAGTNFGLAFGVEGEYYFQESENYAITFGVDFSLGKGGTLQYDSSGVYLPNTEIEEYNQFVNGANPAVVAANGQNINFTQGTQVRYSINYVEIPIGFKIRTNELGGSYIRAAFHLPMVNLMVPVSARGRIVAPNSQSADLYGGGEIKGENIYKDIVPFQVAVGLGVGAEYAPNQDGGLRLTGGLYYNYGLFDATRKIELSKNGVLAETNPNTGFHNIALRLGLIF